MSVKTTYTCDQCGAEQGTPEQFWVVEVSTRPITSAVGYSSTSKSKHWCRACCENYAILPAFSGEETAVEPPPTLEDMIREIVKDEVANADR